MTDASQPITELLAQVANGDSAAADRLFTAVYDELHHLASGLMTRERSNHTLQPTALIHEAFLRLMQTAPVASAENTFQNEEHFIGTAAVVMRRILVDHARQKKAQKRGGDRHRLAIDLVQQTFRDHQIDLLELDEALQELERLDPAQHRLVELRFFGGLSMTDCARLLGISERAAYYEWAHARAWLKDRLAVDE